MRFDAAKSLDFGLKNHSNEELSESECVSRKYFSNATIDEIAATEGIGRKLAEQVAEFLAAR